MHTHTHTQKYLHISGCPLTFDLLHTNYRSLQITTDYYKSTSSLFYSTKTTKVLYRLKNQQYTNITSNKQGTHNNSMLRRGLTWIKSQWEKVGFQFRSSQISVELRRSSPGSFSPQWQQPCISHDQCQWSIISTVKDHENNDCSSTVWKVMVQVQVQLRVQVQVQVWLTVCRRL